MSMLPRHFKAAVVALGNVVESGKVEFHSTGFLVGRRLNPEGSRYYVFLITNRHVITRASNELVMRFNKRGAVGVQDITIPLIVSGEARYSFHPNKDVDVAAIRLPSGLDAGSEFEWFDIETNAITLDEMKNTGVTEGCIVYTIGFPMGIVEDKIKAPFVRLGCLSRIDDAFSGVGLSDFYVDAQAFPGNSGGPVISRPEVYGIDGTPKNNRANLIGVLCAYLPYRDCLRSAQTNEIVMVHRENSGLTKVFPVDRINEVISKELIRTGVTPSSNNLASNV